MTKRISPPPEDFPYIDFSSAPPPPPGENASGNARKEPVKETE